MTKWSHRIFWPFVILAAFALRFYLLEERSLWIDECYSIYTSAISGLRMIVANLSGPDLPVYYILLHYWTKLGRSELAARSFSLLFGMAAFPLLYVTARRLYDGKVARLACLLLAFSWLHIRYSQEARVYTFFVCISLAVFYFFTKLLSENRMRYWVLFTALTMLNLATHAFSIFLLATQVAIFLFMFAKDSRRMTPFLVSLLVISSFFGFFLSGVYINGILFRFAGHFSPTLNLSFVPATLAGFVSGHPSFPLAYLSIPLSVAILFKPVIKAVRERRRETLILLAHILIPIAVLAVMSFDTEKISIRYMIFVLPFFLIIMAAALNDMKSTKLAATCTVALILLNLISVCRYYYEIKHDRQTWRDVAHYLKKESAPDDLLIVAPKFDHTCVDYYLGKGVESEGLQNITPEEIGALDRMRAGRKVWIIYDQPITGYFDRQKILGEYLQKAAEKTEFPIVYVLGKDKAAKDR